MKLIFRAHALQRMFERVVSAEDVESVVALGEVIEDYPDDFPLPSRLLLGVNSNRPLHVGAADNGDLGETIIITVYEPNATEWDETFRVRKP